MIEMHFEDWAPYCFVIRDLLYEGNWTEMEKDAKQSDRLMLLIENAKKYETQIGAIIHGNLFLPTSVTELRSFFENCDVKLQNLTHMKLEGLYEMASVMIDGEEYEEANAVSALISEICGDNAFSEEITGSSFVLKGDYESGIPHLEKSVELDENFIPAFSSLSLSYYNTCRYDKAIKTCEKILQRHQEDLMAYITIVDSYIKMGQSSRAIGTLEKMNEAIPDNITGKIQLYRLLRETHRDEEANKIRTELLAISPSQPNELEILSLLLFETGQYFRAEQEIMRYLQNNPHHTYLKILFVIPYVKKGEFEKAKEIIDEFKKEKIWYFYGKQDLINSFLSESEKKGCGLL
jgi:tetratricopeptide (TPR) repeat protein